MQDDSAEAIARDIAAIGRISAVPSLLKIVCQTTGMEFAAIARLTDSHWTACAVEDRGALGVCVGQQFPAAATLCHEARVARRPVVIDHASRDPRYCAHAGLQTFGIERYISVPIVLPSGEYFGNLCAIDRQPAAVPGAQTVGIVMAFAGLIAAQLQSERVQTQTASALKREQALAELREQFIAVLGHDLRNPLSTIAMMAELLRLRTADPVLVKMGDRLDVSVQRMLRMIEDMMDFAQGRLGSGIQLDVRIDSFLADSLRDLVAERRASFPERDIEDRIGLLGPVRCDPLRVQQMLSKLLDNALRYGAAEQPIRVDVHTDADMLHIEVGNGGRPIPALDMPHLFEPYWRPTATPPGGGVGMGLYLCEQIARAHGGTLEVTSSAARGTCFRALLPRAGARSADEGPR